MIRNTAGQSFYAFLLGPTGPVSGQEASCSCQIIIDNGADNPLASSGSATEVYPGLYQWPLADTETDGHELRFEPSHPNPQYSFVGQPSLVIYTRETGVNLTKINGFDVEATGPLSLDPLNRLKIINAVLANKVVTEDGGDGKRLYHFRNQTDTADEITVLFDPTTGDRSIVA